MYTEPLWLSAVACTIHVVQNKLDLTHLSRMATLPGQILVFSPATIRRRAPHAGHFSGRGLGNPSHLFIHHPPKLGFSSREWRTVEWAWPLSTGWDLIFLQLWSTPVRESRGLLKAHTRNTLPAVKPELVVYRLQIQAFTDWAILDKVAFTWL